MYVPGKTNPITKPSLRKLMIQAAHCCTILVSRIQYGARLKSGRMSTFGKCSEIEMTMLRNVRFEIMTHNDTRYSGISINIRVLYHRKDTKDIQHSESIIVNLLS